MKKIFSLLLIPVLAGGLFFTGCSAGQEEVIELSYSNFFPSTHLNSVLAEEWINEIESRTGGRVKINYFAGGTLTPAPGVYDGVVQGISDIGMSCFAYTPGRFPVCELVDLPHGYPNGWVATRAANDYYSHFQPEELEDVHALYFHGHGPGVIVTTEKMVDSLDDLNGLVLRATGIGSNVVKALGAEGYGASQGEVYELMAKNVVDGSYTPREVLKGWNQAEVVKYVTNCYEVGNTTMMFVVMNEDKWNSLPSDIQEIFTQVSSDWIDKHGSVWDYYDKIGIDYFLGLGDGRQVIELSDQEVEQWKDAAVEPLVEQYITDKTAQGLDAEACQEYLLERVSYWSNLSPTLEDSVDWVEDNLASYLGS